MKAKAAKIASNKIFNWLLLDIIDSKTCKKADRLKRYLAKRFYPFSLI